MGQIEHGVANQHHQLFVLTHIGARQRFVLSLDDHAFPDPLPELLLRGPKLFAIAANNQRRFLLFRLRLLFLFLFGHRDFLSSSRGFLLQVEPAGRTVNTLLRHACSGVINTSKTGSNPKETS